MSLIQLPTFKMRPDEQIVPLQFNHLLNLELGPHEKEYARNIPGYLDYVYENSEQGWSWAAIGRGKAVHVGRGGDPWSRSADLLRGGQATHPLIAVLRSGAPPAQRAAAAAGLGTARLVDAVPPLIEALDDTARVVRAAASDALRRITGHDVPFDPDGDYDTRRNAQRAWQQWFAGNEAALRTRLRQPKTG